MPSQLKYFSLNENLIELALVHNSSLEKFNQEKSTDLSILLFL